MGSAESLGLSGYIDLVPHSNEPTRFLKTLSKAVHYSFTFIHYDYL